ncbi:MAG TPA: ABC transporter permease, partial [Anaerolineae bacterium]|nr:ABC transporter permease [Anaerolineae bacterium]
MTRYLIRRTLLMIPVLVAASLLVFLAVHLSPGDPVDLIAGPLASEEIRQQVRVRLGLDKSLPQQYFIYIAHIAQGDLGRSVLSRQPVAELVRIKLPITLELGIAAFLVTYLVAVPLGVIAALHRNSLTDYVSMILALLGVSMPSFWFALILIYVFAVALGWFPPTGYGGLRYLILPAVALGLPRVGRVARMMRSSMLEVIGQDYIRTARAKGLPERTVVLVHAVRNALLPILSLMGLDLGYVLGGSVVIENVFARSGVGDMMLKAIYSRDFPVLQGAMLILTAAIVVGNIIA